MVLPRALARANKRGLNKVTRHLVPHLPGFGLLHHRGRKSGAEYSTPINIFHTSPGHWRISLTYGSNSDWVRNVLAAGGCDVTTRGRRIHLTDPVLTHDPNNTGLPAPARMILRRIGADECLDLAEAPPTR